MGRAMKGRITLGIGFLENGKKEAYFRTPKSIFRSD